MKTLLKNGGELMAEFRRKVRGMLNSINWQLAYVLFAIIISSWFIAYYLAWVLIIWRLSAL